MLASATAVCIYAKSTRNSFGKDSLLSVYQVSEVSKLYKTSNIVAVKPSCLSTVHSQTKRPPLPTLSSNDVLVKDEAIHSGQNFGKFLTSN